METTTPMVSSWLVTMGISALVMLVLYRRARRLFGRQAFSATRLCIRIAIFGLLGTMFLTILWIAHGVAPLIGLAAGIGTGLLGIHLTRFTVTEGQTTFTPNPYVGLAVLSLLVGRIAYRLLSPTAFQGISRSPLTAGILLFVFSFYTCYYLAVLLRGRALMASGRQAA
jgi:hypothetical protein